MLTEAKIKQALPMDRPYKVYDGHGLYLLVNPNGGKWWRFRYRLVKEKLLAFGVYPYVSILEARKRRDEAKTLLANGIDPGGAKRDGKLAEKTARENTFQLVAEEWIELKARSLKPVTISKKRWMFNTYVYPAIGQRPIADIEPPELLKLLKAIEVEGLHETAHRTRENCGAVFRYGGSTGRKCRDVTIELHGALIPVKTKSHPAITDPKQLPPLLGLLYSYSGRPATNAALRLVSMLFPRSIELCSMKWEHINWDTAEWHCPAEVMKMKRAHIVPLPRQAIEILGSLRKATGCYQYVFPNDRGCAFPMSDGAVNVALHRMGYQGIQSGHGFRATARTILEEVLGFNASWIEMQLAHEVKDPNGRAYNRTAFIEQRRGMMQTYADYLDGLRTSPVAAASRHDIAPEALYAE